MKVFILLENYPGEGSDVIAVFRTKKKLEEFAKLEGYNLNNSGSSPFYTIKEETAQ